MSENLVLTRYEGSIAILTLNRPERLNAINPFLLEELHEALGSVLEDDHCRSVVLCGAGRAFCSGDDTRELEWHALSNARIREIVERYQEISLQIMTGPKIVIAAVHGWAVGGGLEWVINCDFAVFAESTRCFFPEIGLGLFVTGGVTALLPRLAGRQTALELMLFGEKFDARRASEIGIAWRVVPDDRVLREAIDVGRRIGELPAAAVGRLKEVISQVSPKSRTFREALSLETEAIVSAICSANQRR